MFLAGNGNGKACSCRTLKSRISEVVERLPNHFQICHPFQALWSDLFLCGSKPHLAVSPQERSPQAVSAIANSVNQRIRHFPAVRFGGGGLSGVS